MLPIVCRKCCTISCATQWWTSSCGSTPSAAFGSVSVLHFGCSSKCPVLSHCFSSHFPDDTRCGTSLHMFAISVRYLLTSSAHFASISLLLLSFKSYLYTVDDSQLSDQTFANTFPSLWLSHFLDSVFCRGEVFNFNEVQLTSSSFMYHAYGVVFSCVTFWEFSSFEDSSCRSRVSVTQKWQVLY